MDYLLTFFTSVLALQLPFLWSPGTDAAQLNDYILDYQPLQFNPLHLQERHDRVRRSIDPYLRWNFKAYGRTFNLRLSPVHDSIFSANHRLDMGDGEPTAVDTSFIYEGQLSDDPTSTVHMSLLNGSILGYIHIPGHNTYHIEPSHKHFKEPKYPSIIYPESRMNLDPYRHKRHAAVKENAACGTAAIFEKLREMSKPVDDSFQKRKKRNSHSDSIPHNKYLASYNTEVLSRKRRALLLNPDQTSCFLHLRADNILYKHILSNQGNNEQRAKEEILAMFAIHVREISDIYSNTDFSRKDDPSVSFKLVTFQLQKSTIMKDCTNRDAHYCSDNVDVSNFLDITSLEDHHDFCLVHTFTYRDFIGGTLGLAWVATPTSSNAGVCGGYQRVRDNSGTRFKSLNTGITTLINFKKEVPSRVSQLTFAHEVGHNFGSEHDTTVQCAPYGTSSTDSNNGNYIMFPSANQGNLKNNEKFSICSRDYIAKVLESMIEGRRDYCLKESGAEFCGNNVVEGDEECDCGFEDDCNDLCCIPRPLNGKNETMCKRIPTAVCSPSQGVCCTETCAFIDSGECQAAGDCTEASSCVSNNATCPPPSTKADKVTFCNDHNGVCIKGECLGSICENINWLECSKKSSGDSESEELCFVSCQKTVNSSCISSNDKTVLDQPGNEDFKNLINTISGLKNLTAIGVKKPAGSPCNFNKGYCDILSKCRSINAEGPFKQLTDMIFNPVKLQKTLDWIVDHWWAVFLMVIGAILLMVLFVKVFGYSTPSEDPYKKSRTIRAAQQPTAAGRARSRQPDNKRSRPHERSDVYATDVPMHDGRNYGSNVGQTNFGYDGSEGHRKHQDPPPYPSYQGAQGYQQERPSRRQQFDRIATPKKY